MRLKYMGSLAALAMMLAVAAPVAADAPNACPDPAEGDFRDESTSANETGTFTVDGVQVTYTVSADGETITFSRAVSFCVKGGSDDNSGVISGTTFTVDFLNDGANTPTISNFTVYGIFLTPVTAAAATVTPPSCSAAGTLVIPANTAAVSYSVSPAYTAGASGTFTVTATANAGFGLTGTSQWTLTVAPQLTGAACATGGTLPGGSAPTTPAAAAAAPVAQSVLAGRSLPTTATGSAIDRSLPFLALLVLAGLGFVAQRNIAAVNARR
jgi:hypothetical protein